MNRMKMNGAHRHWLPALLRACALLALAVGTAAPFAPHASAQVAPYGEKQMGEPAEDHLPGPLSKVGVAQRLNTRLPLDARFVDESGRPVRLGDYFGKRPAILALVYYRCPLLCSEELKGLTGALEMVTFTPGKDYDVIVISIDPSEGPALAAAKKREYMKYYGRPETAGGWHFLTGQAPAIDAVTKAAGFGYTRVPGPDGKLDQFAHASAIEIITPGGRIAQYYLGVEYSPKDIRLGLVEASHHQIGSPVDSILTYCYRYDPARNRHSLVVARIVQLGCLITMFALGGFLFVMFRRDIKQGDSGVPLWTSRHGDLGSSLSSQRGFSRTRAGKAAEWGPVTGKPL